MYIIAFILALIAAAIAVLIVSLVIGIIGSFFYGIFASIKNCMLAVKHADDDEPYQDDIPTKFMKALSYIVIGLIGLAILAGFTYLIVWSVITLS